MLMALTVKLNREALGKLGSLAMHNSTDLYFSIFTVEGSQNFNAQFRTDESETNISWKKIIYLPMLAIVNMYV